MNIPSKKRSSKKLKFQFSWKDFILWGFLGLFILFILAGAGNFSSTTTGSEIAISQVVSDAKSKKIESIVVSDTKLEIQYKDGKKAISKKETDTSLYEVFKDAGVDATKLKITVKDDRGLATFIGIISTFLPVLIIIGFFYFIFRQARGAQDSVFQFGSSKAKAFNKFFPNVTFNDVAGVDEAKQELTEIVDFLKHPEKYRAMGARTPKGVLLVGPSGTGKTLLARAVAGEAKVAFFSIAGSEFMEMLVGVGAARVRDLFLTAKKAQPAIIFIDEVDAIGRQRGVGIMGGHDEREQTLNQILVEMDGFTPNEQLVIIAATNRPDILDPALVRPGRFDRRVMLSLPDLEGRREILSIHAKNKPFVKAVDWEKVARRTVGFSGADLENMLNEAAILAARVNKKAIEMDHLEEAATKVKLGPEKKRLQSDDDKKITAYHESGHALVSHFMTHTDPVHRISIVGRGMSLGHTLIPPSSDRVHETRSRLLEQIATMLGGRVAEELIFSEMTTGAADDIEKATGLARTMVIQFGMSALGPINLTEDRNNPYEPVTISDNVQAKIDSEINRIMQEAYKHAEKLLKANRKTLDLVAAALLKKETMESEEFEAIVGKKATPPKSAKV
ncbi:MAG: ATP-dependent zinc metalloprotease FtsH [Candidatus Levybacteria bacterium]|nr:ATP-dependent zinc metalloprotease FtsH [Candidatus Levybacteria bacterium]